MERRIVTVRRVPTGLCTCAHLFGHCFWHMFNDLHRDFVAHLLWDACTNLLGDFARDIDGIFDADRFREVFASLARNEDGEVLALFFRNLLAFCLWHLLLHFDWNLKKLKVSTMLTLKMRVTSKPLSLEQKVISVTTSKIENTSKSQNFMRISSWKGKIQGRGDDCSNVIDG